MAVTEQRVQVKTTRFRIPDITVMRGNPGQQIITRSPLLCVEILSPEDSLNSMRERIDDYLDFNIENIWILDPQRKKAFRADRNGIHEAASAILEIPDTVVRVDLSEFWPS